MGKIKAPTFHLKTEKNAFIPKFTYDANSKKTVKTSATYPDSIIGCWHCSVVKSYYQLSPKLRNDSQKKDLEMKFGRGSPAPSDYLFVLLWPSISVILTITSPHCPPIFIILMSPHYQIILPLKSTNSPPHHHHIRPGVNDSQIIRTQHSGAFLMKTSEKLNHCLPC